MLADDQIYRSWMASVALAVLMALVMVWIRSQIPDDVPVTATAVQAAAPQMTTADDGSMSSAQAAIATLYECVSGEHRTSSDHPCSGHGVVLSQIGSEKHLTGGDASVLHHR
jgi:hypothetical protein